MLREVWWPKHCPCGTWIGLCLKPDVYDPDKPIFVGVCSSCGAAYYVPELFAIHVVDPKDPSR